MPSFLAHCLEQEQHGIREMMDDGRSGSPWHRHDNARRLLAVEEVRVFRGPHLKGRLPMVRIRLDLGELEHYPTSALGDFTDRLLERLPGLSDHICNQGRPGGLAKRLREGTWIGHVIEHVALELQHQAGAEVARGLTRSVKGKPGVYDVYYAFEEEMTGLAAGWLALKIVNSLLPMELQGISGAAFHFSYLRDEVIDSGPDEAIETLRRLLTRLSLGPTSLSLMREALRRNIPVYRLDSNSLVQLGQGRYQQRICGSVTTTTSSIAVDIASNKHLTKALLRKAGVPVPDGKVVESSAEAVLAAAEIGFPAAVKPLNGNQGKGVYLNLAAAEDIEWAFSEASQHDSRVVVERQLAGRDYRILVIAGKVAAVAERIPAHVTGDGARSIAELIAAENDNPRRGTGHEKPLTGIKIDSQLEKVLENARLSLASVLPKGKRIALRDTANLSTGGISVDCTNLIHPDNAAIARRAAAVVGLDVAGIDFVTPDIAVSAHEAGGGIVEVNASPGFRMHLNPSRGRARNVARPVLNMLFPPGRPSRIPIFAVTGTNGKSTTVRMLAAILREEGLTAGVASTCGIFVGSERIAEYDASGPEGARTVLHDQRAEAAVLETARGGIIRAGLGFDRCDAAAVLNIAPDHLGLDGIDTLEEMAEVKAVVARAVQPNGHCILNADDRLASRMAREAGGSPVYFTMKPRQGMAISVRNHIAGGGLVIGREANGEIVLHRGSRSDVLLHVSEIPATHAGAAAFNVQNAMAAAAMGLAQGISRRAVIAGLRSFSSSFEENPGRFNVAPCGAITVVLDYAHNPAGLAELGKAVKTMRRPGGRIVATVGIAGDRRDEDITAMGSLAARLFDEVYFWEDEDGRGRPQGAVGALLLAGAEAVGSAAIQCVGREEEAAEVALRAAQAGDVVVVTAADTGKMWHKLQTWMKPGLRRQAAGRPHAESLPAAP